MWIRPGRTRTQDGGGLAELLVAIAIALLITSAVLVLFSSSNKEMVRMLHYSDLHGASQTAIDTLTRDIRDANRVTAYTTNSLQLEDAGGLSILYTFNASQGTLRRAHNGQSKTLLRGCDALTFTLGKRNPSGGFAVYPASSVAECKVVNVSWRCSRTLFGRKHATDNITTANIIIRRQGA